MKIFDLRLIFAALLFVFVFISGIWLSKYGRPLNVVIFTIHKLISILTLILTVIVIYTLQRGVDLKTFDYYLLIITSVFFISAIITGGFLSIEKLTNNAMLISHKILSLLTVISVAFTIYSFVNRRV